MRTKTLVLSAALLAAGITSSIAQSNVYSANIVGYVTTVISTNFNLVANPFDNNGSNDLNGVLGTLPNKSSVQVWNGTSFLASSKGGSPSVWTPNFSVPAGNGFFVKVNSGSLTQTFVGSVIISPGASVTSSLPTTFQLVGSPVPFSGTLNDTNLGLQVLPNKSTIQVWTGSNYVASSKGGSPSVWTPNQNVSAGQGFFVKSQTTTNWVQSLPPAQ